MKAQSPSKGVRRFGMEHWGSSRDLATLSRPTLRYATNHSIVMSDFYNVQSEQHLVFEGSDGQPDGAVTILGTKMHMFSQEPVFTNRDYAGRIYYGQCQFYIEPKVHASCLSERGQLG